MLGMILIGLAGCVNRNAVNVYLLSQDEIVMCKKGTVLTVPYDGVYYSTQAQDKVMKARAVDIGLKR